MHVCTIRLLCLIPLTGRTPRFISMLSNQNHTYTLGSLPPNLTPACPCCPQRFKSKGGRTRHIQVKHPDYISQPHASAPDTGAHTSPTPSLNLLQPFFHDPSPVHASAPDTGAHISPTPSLNSLEPSFHDPSPVPSHYMPSLPPSCDGFNADSDIDMDKEHPHPDTSPITRVFHPKLNGMSIYIYIFINVNFSICRRDLR